MLSRIFSNKQSPQAIAKQVDDGYQWLWQRKFSQAQTIFQEAVELSGQDINKHLLPYQKARLGLWAIGYLHDQNKRTTFQKIVTTQSNIDFQLWFIVAKVFIMNRDTTPVALEVYHHLLQQRPEKNWARNILKLLLAGKTPWSELGGKLLSQIQALLPHDVEAATLAMRWALLTDRLEEARQISYQIGKVQPEHRDVHRCLGYLAEKAQNWKDAQLHYRQSRDWLRVASVCTKANEVNGVAHALQYVPTQEHHRVEWLYCNGWLNYHRNNWAEALNYWHALVEQYPDHQQALAPMLADVQLKLGAETMLIQRNPASAQSYLFLADSINHNFHTTTYRALYQKITNNSIGNSTYEKLVNEFGDTSLYHWWLGLWHLGERNPEVAHQNFVQAWENGIEKHLEDEAVNSASWLALYVRGQRDSPLKGPADQVSPDRLPADETLSPFFQSVLPSLIWANLNVNKEFSNGNLQLFQSYLEKRAAWTILKTISLGYQKNWLSASQSLAEYPDYQDLRWAIIKTGISHSIRDQDWLTVEQLCVTGSEINGHDQPLAQLCQAVFSLRQAQLWQSGKLAPLEYELYQQLETAPANTRLHHSLAMICTRLAIIQDQGPRRINSIDYWKRAIGHWAVTLSDDDYWQQWLQKRIQVYETEIENKLIKQIRQTTIPEMLNSYHTEFAGLKGQKSELLARRYQQYAVMLDYEIDMSHALRYGARTAERNNINIPDVITRFPSALLLRTYGFEGAGHEFVEKLTALKLSPHEANLIRSGFSPLAEILLMVEAGEYKTAITMLNKLHQDAPHDVEVRQELIRVRKRFANNLIQQEAWTDAVDQIQAGLKLQPMNEELGELLATALAGWAKTEFSTETYEEIVKRLTQARKKIRTSQPEFDAVLGEAHILWGHQLYKNGQVTLALKQFEAALALEPDNRRAKSAIAVVYHERAMDYAKKEQFKQAEKNALLALDYEEDPATDNLLAGIYHGWAVEVSKKNRWSDALEYAEKALQRQPVEERLNFLVALHMDYAVYLAKQDSYEAAIRVAEHVLEMPYDKNSLRVDELLSALYTDLGVNLINAHNRVEAWQCWKLALEYDPDNNTARQNLIRSGGHFW